MAPKKRRGGRHTQPSPVFRRDGAGYFGLREEVGADGLTWCVTMMGADRTTKTYTCPGCGNTIEPGCRHIVAWPRDRWRGVEDRRHWHRACWQRRLPY